MKKLAVITGCICFIIILCSVIYANYFTGTIDSAKSGNAKRLEKQLEAGDNADYVILQKALKCAVEYNRPQSVKVLLKYLKSPDFPLNDIYTPLQLASAYGNNEIVKILIDHGANVNYSVRQKEVGNFESPLSVAISNQKYDTARILVENGANTNDSIFSIIAPYKENLEKQRKDFIKFCVKKGVDLKGEFGSSAVEIACYSKDRNFVEYLLKNGASPSDWSLVWAAENKDISLINELYKSGKDRKSQAGLYALMHAIIEGNDKTVEYLLKSGVPIKPEETTEYKKTGNTSGVYSQYPIGEAVERNDYHALQMLLEKGADINAGGIAVINKPLYIAVKNCSLKMVRFLLERGAEVKFKGTSETLLFDTVNDVKKNQVDWFDFQHKRDCDRILKLLHEYKNK